MTKTPMQKLLALPDAALVRSVFDTERYGDLADTTFQRFRQIRSQLSMLAWNSYAQALNCDSGTIAKSGVQSFSLEQDQAERFAGILADSPPATLVREDFASGHMATVESHILKLLNGTNDYREVTPSLASALDGFLHLISPEIERAFGHPWRVASIRHFYLKPGVSAGRHLDGWPPAMRKLFILPHGATRKSGTTWFRLRDGSEMMLESERPIWALFENSVVDHALVSSEIARPTIEVDLVPAATTSPEPLYAGLNGWYPWFPSTAALHEATRMAVSLAASPMNSAEEKLMTSGSERSPAWLWRLLRA